MGKVTLVVVFLLKICPLAFYFVNVSRTSFIYRFYIFALWFGDLLLILWL